MSFCRKFKDRLGSANAVAMFSYFLAALFTKAVAFLTIPVFTNLLSTADYGYVNTYTSVVAIGSFVIGLSLQNAVNGIQKDGLYKEQEYQSAVLTMSLGFLAGMTLLAYLIKTIFAPQFSNLVFFAAILQSYATFVITFVSIEWRLHNRYLLYAGINVLPSLLAILISIAAIRQMDTQKYLGRIIPTVLVQSAFAFVLLVWVLLRGRRFFAPEMWAHALRYCLPLTLHTISLLILEQSDRVMVAALRGMSEAGIYGFTHSVALAVQVIFAALDNVWISWFVKARKTEASVDAINRKAVSFADIYALFVVGFIFVSQELVKLMAQESYWAGIYYIPLFVLASYLNLLYIFPVNNEYYECATQKMAVISISAAVLNIVLNYLVIPYAGGMGAAFTTLLTYAFLLFVHLSVSHKLSPALFPGKSMIRPTITVLIGTAVYYLVYPLWLVRWLGIAVFTVCYCLWLYRKYGKELLESVK